MTSRTATRITLAMVLALGTLASPVSAATSVEVASAALSFWITWGIIYLGIGAALMVIAIATAVLERRAWSALLHWLHKDARAAIDDTADAGSDDAASRAA